MIVDASVAVKWLVVEDDSGQAIDLLGKAEFAAPVLLHCEVANALWKKARRGEINGEGLGAQIEHLSTLVQSVDETPFMPMAADIALEIGHPVYDCVYLSMAIQMERRLATADGRFIRALSGTRYAAHVELI